MGVRVPEGQEAVKLFLQHERGHYSFVMPYTDPTGKEVIMGDPLDVPFEGKGFSVGMTKLNEVSASAAVIWHCGLYNPTWKELEDVSDRLNRAWRVAYGDTFHRFFEGASVYADTIWLWFGS